MNLGFAHVLASSTLMESLGLLRVTVWSCVSVPLLLRRKHGEAGKIIPFFNQFERHYSKNIESKCSTIQNFLSTNMVPDLFWLMSVRKQMYYPHLLQHPWGGSTSQSLQPQYRNIPCTKFLELLYRITTRLCISGIYKTALSLDLKWMTYKFHYALIVPNLATSKIHTSSSKHFR